MYSWDVLLIHALNEPVCSESSVAPPNFLALTSCTTRLSVLSFLPFECLTGFTEALLLGVYGPARLISYMNTGTVIT